jgi:hypothetical protein
MMRGENRVLMGHWPQPGLAQRDPSRGDRVERLGYVGPLENLGRSFADDSFRRDLQKLGVELVIRDDPDRWHDFSDLDLYLAVRDWPWHMIRTKPATKLVHSWLTGSVGLLGPEPSYRYWGSDGEDYFEVRTPEDVLAVIRRLRDEPGLYQRVQQCGRQKAPLHDEESVFRQWQAVLGGPVQDAFERWQTNRRSVIWLRGARRQVQRPLAKLRRRWFYLRAKGWEGIRRGLRRRLEKETVAKAPRR